MDKKEKFKVAIITHFSSKETRNKLPLDYRRRLYRFVNRLFGRKVSKKSITYGDISPWVISTIYELEKRDDVELYVISAHTGMKKNLSDFKIRKVHYFFFNTDFTLFLKRIIKNDDVWRKIEPNRRRVKKIVKSIQPDIINLIGADGAYFSTTILGINNIPVFVSMQTVYSNPQRALFDRVDSKNWTTEVEIHKKERYFGSNGKMHSDLLLNNNPKAIIFNNNFPGKIMPAIPEKEKFYDFVTFAQSCSEKKGTFDAIKAISILKKKYPAITLNVCGMRDSDSIKIMEDIINKYDLKDNIIFTDFFEEQNDLFDHLKHSKYAVLPIKLDVVSGTVLQSMALGLPVITNITSGTPRLNKNQESVLLCEIDNIEGLANKMFQLYEDENLANKLRINGYEYYKSTHNPTRSINVLLENFGAVFNHYHFGTEIPTQLLFKNE